MNKVLRSLKGAALEAFCAGQFLGHRKMWMHMARGAADFKASEAHIALQELRGHAMECWKQCQVEDMRRWHWQMERIDAAIKQLQEEQNTLKRLYAEFARAHHRSYWLSARRALKDGHSRTVEAA